MNPNEVTIQLDSEPLGSGDCRNDLASYRRELRHTRDNLAEMGSRPEWGDLALAVGATLLIGILFGMLAAKVPAHEA